MPFNVSYVFGGFDVVLALTNIAWGSSKPIARTCAYRAARA